MLTKKQDKLLQYLKQKMKKDNVSPSFEEMKNAMGLKSKSGIQRLVNGLVERGFIEKKINKKRAINILDNTKLKNNSLIELPLLGKIAAGNPIEAINSCSEKFSVPTNFVSKNKKNYVLKVEGDSMINKGIFDGDYAIIEYTEVAENGEIVVALVNNEEVTLKILEKKNNQIKLIPANNNYKTNIYDPGKIKIQGKLKTILRNY